MKAWILDRITSVKDLHLTDLAQPVPGPGEALVKVGFAALNPADAYLAEGQYPAKPTFPHILGRDGVGTIVSVGSAGGGGQSIVQPGAKVLLLRSDVGVNRAGTLAEFVTVPTESLVPMPAGWTDTQAAGASLVYLTAYQALTQWETPSQPPQPMVVLITGVSGGVGIASVQLAKALGHTVIGLSRSAEKAQRVREVGADLVLDPADKLWTKRAREFLNPTPAEGGAKRSGGGGGGKRVDLAIDNVGGTLLPEVIETLGMWGKVSLVGRLAGPVPSFNTAALFFRRLRIGGVAVGTYTNAETHAAWMAVLALLAKTGARPLVDHVFEFADVQAAFTRLAAGPMGKVLVKVGG
jgi:NADPH2:quinone reductase